ncbi:VacJ family lipoprotein [Robbsia sp. Bb-Pol-6]|uniref:VacJ family lipoprotein n=1 Tax=Robbsia betulipollinis TaxID=2981849 RepID=A0ABT3ZP90_9BURK|nr:VacJ family lipoprotein [Robbsia betulipollinis]MCY0388345.1 VacJ family lipoprotein [Robbsia betulipollinis]
MDTTRAAWAVVTAGTLLAGCSTVQTPSKEDPFEGFNRTVFKVNDKIDQVAIRPVAKAYNAVLPQPVRTSVSNFFSNIGDVTVAANKYAQGDIAAGTETVMRVVINTIFGLGGLFDVATQAKLPKYQADFGLTLGHYGVPAGPYLVLPILGPSTVRDAAGFVVDRYVDPSSYIEPTWAAYTLYGVRAISLRASLLNATDLVADAALDKYSFIRNGYLQRRHYLLGQDDETALPDYGDADGGAGIGGTSGPATNLNTPAAGAQGASATAPGGASAASATGASAAAADGASSASGTAATTRRKRQKPADLDAPGQTLPRGGYLPSVRFW